MDGRRLWIPITSTTGSGEHVQHGEDCVLGAAAAGDQRADTEAGPDAGRQKSDHCYLQVNIPPSPASPVILNLIILIHFRPEYCFIKG